MNSAGSSQKPIDPSTCFKSTCQYCYQVCVNGKDLDDHIKGYHRGNFPYDLITDTFQCRACLGLFQSEIGVKIHIKKAHKHVKTNAKLRGKVVQERPKHRCNICHKKFKSKRTLRFHSVWHTEGKENTKPGCQAKNDTAAANDLENKPSRQKIKNNAQPQFPRMNKVYCTICLLMFTTANDLDRHKSMNPNGECRSHEVLDKIQNKRVRCINRGCLETFLSRKDLEDHMKNNHERNSLYKCKFCGKMCRDNYELRRHEGKGHSLNKVTGEVEYKCQVPGCSRIFSHPSQLKSHERAAHLKKSAPECKQCGVKFENAKELRRHRKVHGKKGQHPCGDCGRLFKNKGDASRHERMHAGRGWHSCRFCLKVFRDKGVLNKHELRSHLKLKLYPCNKCGMFFASSDLMETHMKTHEA